MTLTLAEIDRLRAAAAASDEHVALEMDEETFRGFYDRTATALWKYLARIAGPHEADDLLQDTYYRLLRSRITYQSDAHRRNALFAIATNLARDRHRRRHTDPIAAAAHAGGTLNAIAAPASREPQVELTHALGQLAPRDRGMLWLAYAQGWSHAEIAAALGVKCASIKPMLFRARRRLANLLRAGRVGRGER